MILRHDCTVINIYLHKIISNYRIVQKHLKAGSLIAAVIKANAYGLGHHHVVEALNSVRCRDFCVSNLSEALLVNSENNKIYIMHGINSLDMARECSENSAFIPVINHMQQLEHWVQVAKSKSTRLKAIIQFDTGMSRLGFAKSEVVQLSQSNMLDYIEVEYVMSHMSCAEQPNHPLTQEQFLLFQDYMKFFPGIKATFANSAGIFLGEEFHFDMVRPGCALYGINPTVLNENPMHSVVELYGYILQRRILEEDQYIGYRAQYRGKKGDKLLVIECGYADGYVRSLSGKGICYVEGYFLPVVGIISMDIVIIDASCLPEQIFNNITHVEMLGDHIKIDDVAKHASTVSYEILTTRFSDRGRKIYYM